MVLHRALIAVAAGLCIALAAESVAGADSRRRAVGRPFAVILEPSSGPIAGGTTVRVRGRQFEPATRVFFDGLQTAAQFVSATEMRTVTPPHGNGYVSVTVVTGRETVFTEYFYVPPAMQAIAPRSITTVAGIGKLIAEGRRGTSAPVDAGDVAIDRHGNVFLAEPNLAVIRKVSADGTISRFAGIGVDFAGSEIGDGGAARNASLVFPQGVAVGPDGLLYIADTFNNRVRRVNDNGTIQTIAGTGPNGSCCLINNFSGDGGPAIQARLSQPNQIVFDGAGNMFILDAGNYRIRRVSREGIITTVAGNGVRAMSGDGGPATAASFDIGPNGDTGALEIDGQGNLYLAEVQNLRVRRIDAASGLITTVAGGGGSRLEGEPAVNAFLYVRSIAIDPGGDLYVSDSSRIRRVDRQGRISTVFGTTEAGFTPDGSDPPREV